MYIYLKSSIIFINNWFKANDFACVGVSNQNSLDYFQGLLEVHIYLRISNILIKNWFKANYFAGDGSVD